MTYFKDKYAVDGLRRIVGEGKKVSVIKNSPFATLLKRPWIRERLAEVGGAFLTPEH